MSLAYAQIFEPRLCTTNPAPPSAMMWKLKESCGCQRGPKSAALIGCRVKTDQLQFRILRRSVDGWRLSAWCVEGRLGRFFKIALHCKTWSRVDSRATDLPQIKLRADCHCVGICPRCPLTPFYGRGRKYEDLPRVVSILKAPAPWV